ncbi:MAG TPA: V-type ATP synthase subunit F [Gemmatimonadota bacterium]|jgi:vacuolar-type H+-ATPase subunit F/Vma7
MKGGVAFVVRPALVPGVGLAGLRRAAVDDGIAAAARTSRLGAEGVVVVLLEDRLYDDLPEEARRALSASPLPFVVPFPGPTWAVRPPAEEYVVELLRQAIGYRVRIR